MCLLTVNDYKKQVSDKILVCLLTVNDYKKQVSDKILVYYYLVKRGLYRCCQCNNIISFKF